MQDGSIGQDFIYQEVCVSLLENALKGLSGCINEGSDTYLKLLRIIVGRCFVTHRTDCQVELSCGNSAWRFVDRSVAVIIQLRALQRSFIRRRVFHGLGVIAGSRQSLGKAIHCRFQVEFINVKKTELRDMPSLFQH